MYRLRRCRRKGGDDTGIQSSLISPEAMLPGTSAFPSQSTPPCEATIEGEGGARGGGALHNFSASPKNLYLLSTVRINFIEK